MGLAVVVLMYGVTELVLFAAISIKYHRVFTFTAFEAQRRVVDGGNDPFGTADMPARLRIRKEVIHPYLGYVHDPRVEQTSPYGISDVSPVQHRSPGKLIVGIFGGSFAEDIAYNMADALAAQLKPFYPSREIVVVKAAIGGYKQPQQLMALTYFTALGGDFDIVINLDGFNDVALPVLENMPQTNPFFPRQWHLRMRAAPDPDFLVALGRIRFIDSLSAKWTAAFRSGPLRYSVTANTLWRIGDQLLYNAAVAERARLPQMSSGVNDYAAAGPPASYASDEELYAALASAWAESSYDMYALAKAKGIRYIHFLQPNQYLEGTKPMTPDERHVAILETHPYAKSVRTGYPLLRSLGKDLVRRGVEFVDLTGIFASTREPIYRDNCCHVNGAGQQIVIAAIAKAITGGRTVQASPTIQTNR